MHPSMRKEKTGNDMFYFFCCLTITSLSPPSPSTDYIRRPLLLFWMLA
jgi:hypothetical protein